MEQLQSIEGVREVRGLGLLVGVQFESPIALRVKHNCFDRKLLITSIGDDTIRMVPPLILAKINEFEEDT